jgi:hypothetical protein
MRLFLVAPLVEGAIMLAQEDAGANELSLVITTIVVALIAASGGILSYIQGARARKMAMSIGEKKVDAEAYERARKYDQEVVDRLTEENKRLRDRLDEVEGEYESLQRQLMGVYSLQREVTLLRIELDSKVGAEESYKLRLERMEVIIQRLRAELQRLSPIDVGVLLPHPMDVYGEVDVQQQALIPGDDNMPLVSSEDIRDIDLETEGDEEVDPNELYAVDEDRQQDEDAPDVESLGYGTNVAQPLGAMPRSELLIEALENDDEEVRFFGSDDDDEEDE